MRFQMRLPGRNRVGQVGKTVPVTIDGVQIGEVVIRAVDGPTVAFDVDAESPAARMVQAGELRNGSFGFGGVTRRPSTSDGWRFTQAQRLNFSREEGS